MYHFRDSFLSSFLTTLLPINQYIYEDTLTVDANKSFLLNEMTVLDDPKQLVYLLLVSYFKLGNY